MKMQQISQKVSKNIINNVFNFAFPLKISNFAHEIGKTPSFLRTPSIPRTAGAEYLLRGKTFAATKKSSFYRGRILAATN